MATPRLDLPDPSGTDLISLGDDVISEIVGVLDDSAIFAKGVHASRPAAADLDGKFYLSTDISILYLSDGTNWHEVSRGGGTVPIGGLLDYAGATDPSDTRFILADGRAISRATYAALFALIDDDYGPGNGTTTFNIPDLRGRGSVGPDNMGTAAGAAGRMASNNTRAAVGGTETLSLVTGNMPSHTHAVGTLDMDTTGSHDHAASSIIMGYSGTHNHGVGTYAIAGSGSLTTGDDTPDHVHSGNTSGHSQTHTHDMADIDAVTIGMTGSGGGISLCVTPGQGGTPYVYSVAGASNDHFHSFVSGGASARHQHPIASHTHTMSGSSAVGGDHQHTLGGSVATGGSHKHTLSGSTAAAGSGTAFNKMNPYLVLNKIIRVS